MFGNIIAASFTGPAGLSSWVILLSAVVLVIPVVFFSGLVKKVWGYTLSLGLALLPLLVGLSGAVYSLYVSKNVLLEAPKSLYWKAKALGDYVSLSSVFFGAIPTLILWILSLITFLIASRIRAGKEVEPPVFKEGKSPVFFLVSASFAFVPALAGMTGIYYGLILKAHAVINVPVKEREAVISGAEAVKNYSGVSGFTLTVLFIIVFRYIWKRSNTKEALKQS
ncbi:MAG: hypothetical protein ACOCSE_00125 [Chitinivibrionales bacterium]